MIQSKKRYFIADMGIGHLMTTDEKFVEIAYASPLIDTGELIQFTDASDAEAFVGKWRENGGHIQVLLEEEVPWDAAPIDYDAVSIDWPSVKELVKQVLEKAVTSEKSFRKEAAALGVSYEDFLAAAITELISKEIETQLNG